MRSIKFAAVALLTCISVAALAQISTPFHLLSAASTNATSIKGSNGQIVSVVAINTSVSLVYLKFYDIAATPTCNSTAVKLSFPVPFGSGNSGGGFVAEMPQAVQFLNGIGMCLTGGIADNDNTNAVTGIAVNVTYK